MPKSKYLSFEFCRIMKFTRKIVDLGFEVPKTWKLSIWEFVLCAIATLIRPFRSQNLESRSCPKLVFLYDSRHPHPWYVHVWHSTFQRFTRSAAALMFVCCAFSTISATDFAKSAAYRQKDSFHRRLEDET